MLQRARVERALDGGAAYELALWTCVNRFGAPYEMGFDTSARRTRELPREAIYAADKLRQPVAAHVDPCDPEYLLRTYETAARTLEQLDALGARVAESARAQCGRSAAIVAPLKALKRDGEGGRGTTATSRG